ncbi:MAG TPA: twin-arginine translocase TatA/TatE family subunit [Candidatus Saccharimonadales bacterium]|nr:twin-arginine translocase TatA/TatE family subunit [Candidatus Saccharimonadales bacterium]
MVTPTFAFLEFNTPELLIILVIILLLFGGKKLPELSRSLGSSMRELRKGVNGDEHDKNEKTAEKAKPQSPAS